MSNILSLTLTLLLFVSLLPFCHPARFVVNRTKIFYCYASKGDHVPKDLRYINQLCVKPYENCISYVQFDGERYNYYRGCNHKRFCKMAWRVGVNQMISCEQCDYEFCNASGG
ncbi:uncharacterized protein LOC103505626 isoform X1 [Diaphorina citri]|uniref:Uncharacterized protein LOC103505626 isoform X1 n=1 Tax=Diaphorina citri TaxID=121845 RepID=A0A1S3CUQ0_DIACI|nr:uncharacterized protein LOC103505626 isoform X1 [Diaphorina citri]KAI5700865.1 hypothetical protein M8J75_003630 [Diaphorina citri]